MKRWIESMRHFLIITNTYKDADHALKKKLCDYIRSSGGTSCCFYSDGETFAAAAPLPGEIPAETDGILVLGGDGTLIRAASRLVQTRLPLIGVNLGTLGYLCELEEQNLFAAIDRLMAEDYIVERRMMLEGGCIRAADAGEGTDSARQAVKTHVSGESGIRNAGEGTDSARQAVKTHVSGESGIRNGGEGSAAGTALNDVVIHRTGALSVVSLVLYVNGEYLNTFRADGMIIATPTGSTGYNMSAGGPIVDPKAEMILITPINAHNMNSRSIVVGAEDEVVVEIAKRRYQRDELVEVSYDGDGAGKLSVGDRLIVRRAKETVRICKLSRKSFLELLSRKMQVYT